MRRRRWWAVTVLLGCALVAAAWTVLLIARTGLETADKLASVLGGSGALAFGAAALWVAVRTRQEAATAETAGGPVQTNTASGQATVYGVQGGNLTVGDPVPLDDR